MNERVLKILGYDEILRRVSERTVSSLGRDAVLLLVPSNDAEEVRELNRETKEAEEILISHQQYPLMSYSDVSGELTRLKSGAQLNGLELQRVALLHKAARRASKSLAADIKDPKVSITKYAGQLSYDSRLIETIDAAVLGEDEIADNASGELAAIRKRIRTENSSIRDRLNQIIRGREYSKYLQDAIVTMRDGRFVVPVKQEYRSQIPGIVHGESGSGATLFIEPMGVVEANNHLRELEIEEQKEIDRILKRLSDMARPWIREMETDIVCLTALDVIFAKAQAGISARGFCAQISNDRTIDIRSGRHPLIDEKTVIPVSLHIEPEQKTLIITGPNTGGKTVTLKLVGLLAAMHQSGMMLPAYEGSSLPVFDDIFADIGDEQSIEQSLSTFSSHMKNTVYILRHATQDSLVLLDELGAGTDPDEGTALALAILTELNERGCKVLTTTHYGEIKAFAMTAPGFINASMEFDSQSLKPTYHLQMGIAGNSNAIQIAKRLGLKSAIIEKAKGFMDADRLEYDRLLFEAEKTKGKAQKELDKAYEIQARAEELDRKIKSQERELEEKRQKTIETAKREALDIIRNASNEAEEIIRDANKTRRMSESDATKTIEKTRKKIKEKKASLETQPKKTEIKTEAHVEPGEIALGEEVHVISLNVDATVLELPNDKGMVGIQAGIMKMNAHYTDLARRQPKKNPYAKGGHVARVRKTVGLSLDVHGMNVEEAILEVDRYLDNAFLEGLHEVSIVHGKGTGALRTGVQNYLRHHPHVDSFRLGKYGEGETGVTIVTLK